MTGITADPTTKWTEGQSVVTADGKDNHWNASKWVTGKAPA